MLKLIALVVPLGLDTFAVSAALGIAGLDQRQRLRVALLFAVFEGGMPMVGLAVGSVLSAFIGDLSEWAAIVALVGLGAFMVLSRAEGDEKASLLARTRGLSMLGLGLSISLDELAIGFTLGLVRVPIAATIAFIAVQAFVVTQLGLRLGARVSDSLREGAEKLAGAVLILLGIVLTIARLKGITL